jgi:hypothetical protein
VEMCDVPVIEETIVTCEEQAVHNIPEDNILADEEQSCGIGIQKNDDVDNDSTDSRGNSTTLVPVDEERYTITSNCNKNYCINACSNRQEWEELTSVESFSYASEDIRVGDIVTVITQESNDETVAEIREIKKPNMEDSPNDDYYVLIFWYYTGQEIQQNFRTMKAWPSGHSCMKTTHMAVILGTSIKGQLKDTNCIYFGKIFDYVKRRIVTDTHKDVKWAKRSILLKG